jgi:2-deoxystreptamine N-acetyl-D-glucosaminyltransferase/2-deoxystreptamine glucosyltransferase
VVRDGVTGFLVPPGDGALLAERIDRLRREPALWSRLARGARDAARAYGWEAHLSALENVLEEAGRGSR